MHFHATQKPRNIKYSKVAHYFALFLAIKINKFVYWRAGLNRKQKSNIFFLKWSSLFLEG